MFTLYTIPEPLNIILFIIIFSSSISIYNCSLLCHSLSSPLSSPLSERRSVEQPLYSLHSSQKEVSMSVLCVGNFHTDTYFNSFALVASVSGNRID